MRTLIRRARTVDPILIQAVLAAALSFAHIHDVAASAGQGGWKAWAYPVSVDLLMIMAWKRMRTPDVPHFGAWCWFLLSLAASLAANIATSGVMDLSHPPSALRVIVAGWPGVAFLGGMMLAHTRTATELREDHTEKSQEVAGEPAGEAVEEVDDEPVSVPEKPVLVSYREAAEDLGVAEGTVRTWAFNELVTKYPGPTGNSVRVDLRECKRVQSRRLAGV
ncbi:DUF2637 domain-containing protein [Streptomyces sp. DH12]|uniref:DUF2637 domain-containing protein n=1 Tax=Streptomyces sp. DH12 TaxID=2857010 RepID=UPI001E4E80E1|nr:DUF2637 domain-containing protein [Streptomyces sp. DH12]